METKWIIEVVTKDVIYSSAIRFNLYVGTTPIPLNRVNQGVELLLMPQEFQEFITKLGASIIHD